MNNMAKYPEIAERMGTTVRAVQDLRRRALDKLRDEYISLYEVRASYSLMVNSGPTFAAPIPLRGYSSGLLTPSV